jgi:carotenoid cleavage dioxygenase
MLHDFLITQDYVLLILPSLMSKGSRTDRRHGFFTRIEFDASLPMRVMVLKKSDFSLVREYELPPGFVFHFGNAWQDKSGVIRFDASLYPNIEVLQDMSNMMVGDVSKGHTNSKMALFELHPNGKTHHYVSDVYSEFPKVQAHLQGQKADTVYHISTLKNTIWNDTVCSYNVSTGKTDQYCFGADFHVEEHLPVSGKNGNVYLLGTALHYPSKRTCLNVFNSKAISDGPVARAWLTHHLPLGFHGCFVER